jgi:hypothetical protein
MQAGVRFPRSRRLASILFDTAPLSNEISSDNSAGGARWHQEFRKRSSTSPSGVLKQNFVGNLVAGGQKFQPGVYIFV